MSIVMTNGTITPEAKAVVSPWGNTWYGVSDGMGGWYNPRSDVWQPTPYTFACREHAEECAKRFVANAPLERSARSDDTLGGVVRP
jgi:hypothetical protein